MSKFVVRVELHGFKEYPRLHKAMRDAGFKRTVRDDHRAKFELPPGEYRARKSISFEGIFDAAVKAARSVDPAFAVFVTYAYKYKFVGLKPYVKKK